MRSIFLLDTAQCLDGNFGQNATIAVSDSPRSTADGATVISAHGKPEDERNRDVSESNGSNGLGWFMLAISHAVNV